MILFESSIRQSLKDGEFKIDPLLDEQIRSASIDFRLGEWVFRSPPEISMDQLSVHNLYDPNMSCWAEEEHAQSAKMFCKERNIGRLVNVDPDDLVIGIKPQETIMVFTEEFVQLGPAILLKLASRTSTARNRLEVWGSPDQADPNYIGRLTFFVTSYFEHQETFLVVGRRYVQFRVIRDETCHNRACPESAGSVMGSKKYQVGMTLADAKKNWTPKSMLAKKHLDWEITQKERNRKYSIGE